MQSVGVLTLASLVFLGSAGALQANPRIAIPDGAKPLTAEDTKNIYNNKTIDFKIVKYYFDGDNKLIGYSRAPKSFATGTWSVNGNEFCMTAVWRGRRRARPVKFNSCSQWFTDGAAYWTKIVSSSSPELVGQVYKGDESMAASGDSVSDVASRIKSRFGY